MTPEQANQVAELLKPTTTVEERTLLDAAWAMPSLYLTVRRLIMERDRLKDELAKQTERWR